MENIERIIEQVQSNSILYTILKILLIVILTFLIKRSTDRLFDLRIKKKINNTKYENKANTVLSIVKNFLNFLIYFVSITYILNIFNIDTTSILAVAGVGGMAVAFAAKSVVEDIITGTFILLEDQFNIGDLVSINGITGTVTFMGIRLTKLKDIDCREIIIPNSEINTVINYSINDMRAIVMINISSFKNIDFVRETIEKACIDAKLSFNGFTVAPVITGVEEFSDYSYKILVTAYTENGRQWEAQRIMRYEIIKKLQNKDISFSSIEVGNK